ncbi:MAG TPA: DUF4124 domain-containing protein [Pelomicrobium sp.]|nr:DUF4124 domain-containing protein [Pelomicrobium sp.]
MRRIAVFAAFLAASPVAHADSIYRWISSQGVITYGNQPPPDAQDLTLLFGDDDRVRDTRRTAPGTAQRSETPIAGKEVPAAGRIVRSVDEATVARSARSIDARTRCEGQPGEDCAEPNRDTDEGTRSR